MHVPSTRPLRTCALTGFDWVINFSSVIAWEPSGDQKATSKAFQVTQILSPRGRADAVILSPTVLFSLNPASLSVKEI